MVYADLTSFCWGFLFLFLKANSYLELRTYWRRFCCGCFWGLTFVPSPFPHNGHNPFSSEVFASTSTLVMCATHMWVHITPRFTPLNEWYCLYTSFVPAVSPNTFTSVLTSSVGFVHTRAWLTGEIKSHCIDTISVPSLLWCWQNIICPCIFCGCNSCGSWGCHCHSSASYILLLERQLFCPGLCRAAISLKFLAGTQWHTMGLELTALWDFDCAGKAHLAVPDSTWWLFRLCV